MTHEPVIKGKTYILILKLFFNLNNPLRSPPKNKLASIAENNGEMIHDKTIPLTPPIYGKDSFFSYHITHSGPFNANVIPIIEPTQECVVDTGISYFDAIKSQEPTEKQTHIQPYIKTYGSS